MAKAKKAKAPKEEKAEKPEKEEKGPVARDGPYVMMLFITLVAIAAGCVFMYLDFDEYGKNGDKPPKEPAPVILKLGDKPPPEAVAPAPAPPVPDPAAPPAPAPMGMGMGAMPPGP